MGISYNPKISTNGLVLALDPANSKSYKVNLVNYSSYYAFDGTYGWQNIFPAGASVTTGIQDPLGTNLAVRLTCTNTTNALFRVYFPAFTPSGTEPWVVSFYVRKISGTTSSISGQLWSDLADLTPSINYQPLLVTGQWVRVSVTAISAASSRNFLDLYSDNTSDYVLDFFGIQIEPGTTASSYTPTYGSVYPRTAIYNIVNSSISLSTSNLSFTSSSLSFNGSNTNVTVSSFTYDPNSTGFTYEIVFSPTINSTSFSTFRRLITLESPGGNYYGLLIEADSRGLRTDVPTASRYGINTNYTFTGGTTYHLVWMWYNWLNYLYINGQLVLGPTSDGGSGTALAASRMVIGGLTAGNYFPGYIYKFNFYSRVLPSQEVKQNFRASRLRFGL